VTPEELTEKIKEIKRLLQDYYLTAISKSRKPSYLFAQDIMKDLTELGVVLADESGELPPRYFANRKKMPWISDYDVEKCAQEDMLKAGFKQTHPLLEQGD